MVQLCPRCQRANPDKAAFCHFDGCLLRQGAGAPGGEQFLQEFVFPSGRKCLTFEELARGCYAEWEDARNLLHDGSFARFLAGQGRADLAHTAREAQGEADPDIALTNFIANLPAVQVQGPKLGLSPRRLVIGPVRVGEQRQVQLRLANEGRGLLQGKVTVADAMPWLTIVDGDDHTAAVKTPREQSIVLRADTSGLVVGQNYSAKLLVVTNGGVAEVPIRLDLTARPCPLAPYQGTLTPHDLARRMRDNPHPAVKLLESGEIARWFESNGWTYPIVGATAPGLAAVQQFFEELGLARAPQIVVSDTELRLQCKVPEIVKGQLTIRSPARKLVYARAESDSPWLKVTTASVSGQGQATIEFAIDSTLTNEDRTYTGTLRVVANAGQAFNVPVHAEVQGNQKSGWFRPSSKSPTPPPGEKGGYTSPRTPAAPLPALTGPGSPLPALTGPGSPLPALTGPGSPLPALTGPGSPAPAWVPVTKPRVAPSLTLPAPGRLRALVQSVMVGALLGGLVRLVLVFPADLFARLLGSATRQPVPGSLQAWLQAPPADEGFLRLFVLATWWVGALIGALLVWRRESSSIAVEQGGRWSDLVCGVIAGAIAGTAGAATLACGLVIGDTLPRLLLGALAGGWTLGPILATPLWIVVATACWLVLGGIVGLVLGLFGQAGRQMLVWLASPLVELLRMVGLSGAAQYFTLRLS